MLLHSTLRHTKKLAYMFLLPSFVLEGMDLLVPSRLPLMFAPIRLGWMCLSTTEALLSNVVMKTADLIKKKEKNPLQKANHSGNEHFGS